MSTDLNLIIENLRSSEKSLDLHRHFNNGKFWRQDNLLISSATKWLGFHAENYFSPFRACFLFELASFQSLDYFSPLHCRDGALTLLRFFFQHPKPISEDSFLLIHERLENLIPDAWKTQSLVYRKSPKSLNFKSQATRKLVLLNSAFGPMQASVNFTENLLSQLQGQKDSFDLLSFVNFTPYSLDDTSGRDLATRGQFETFLNVVKGLGLKSEVKSPLDYQSDDLSNSYVLDLNELHFYYADSAFEDLALSKGARPLRAFKNREAIYTTDLSFYHQIEFFKPEPALNSKAEEVLELYKKSESLQAFESLHQPREVNSKVKIVSPVFEDFAYGFAQLALDPVKVST